MTRHCLLLVLLSVVGIRSAQAEGGTCPAGYYPVNTPGVMGCAPIPGYGGDGQPVDVGPSWMTTWGAISADATNGTVATSDGQSSKRRAQKSSVDACRASGGGKACRVWIAFHNQCAAMAASQSFAATYSAGTIEEASSLALGKCAAQSTHCRVVAAKCSYPVRIR